MRLRVLVPTEAVVDEDARKVVAEAENGYFALLPRHVDFVAALVPGLLLFEDATGAEGLVAVDEGVLVKRGREVTVSTRKAVRGSDLETLRETVEREFVEVDEYERVARSALARLEAGAIRRFLELRQKT